MPAGMSVNGEYVAVGLCVCAHAPMCGSVCDWKTQALFLSEVGAIGGTGTEE